MNSNRTWTAPRTGAVAAVGLALLVGACEKPAHLVEQTGYRGTGAQQVIRTKLEDKLRLANVVPAPPYDLPPDDGGPRAGAEYQNVKVLQNLSVDQFNHLMAAITAWVAPPEQGCNYCHNPENMASDAVYTKIVSRRMIQMTQNINNNWKSHVQATGVTCYTCHRGNAIPRNVWNETPDRFAMKASIRGQKTGQNTPGQSSVALASLPYDVFTPYLLQAQEIRLQGVAPNRVSTHSVPIASAEGTYGLMMHMSNSLGVNCTYCHNSGNFQSWAGSQPARGVAWYGIRMVREANNNYINNLKGVFPANRLGPLGDPYKINCTTCHQGVAKPLYGVSMLKDYAGLRGAQTVPAVLQTPADLNAAAAADEAMGAGGPPASAPPAAPLAVTPIAYRR
ncbi:MAG: photosynthetic reaction center cytochrome c subunit [Chitinophagaceae bacterium]|nr:photosynthetic reaction center cytochrome c subunit [Rubrivivax sp.]